MYDTSALLAAINDNQSFNDKTVVDLLVDLLRDTEGHVGPSDALLYLRRLESSKEPRGHIAAKLLNSLEGTDFTQYSQYLDELSDKNISFHHLFDPDYPRNLWRLTNQPLALYRDGPAVLEGDNIAMVGTRQATDSRIEDTQEISETLAEAGYTIVSGMATGIDRAAHSGALSVDGTTLAILPGDIENPIPKSNSDIADEIRKSGALLSEISQFASMHNGRYVERNRITSGISDALIVMASGETGGTIRQSEIAQKQGVPRFLYSPGDDSHQSPAKLLNMGFQEFEEPDELFNLLDAKKDLFQTESTKRRTLSEFS